MTREQIDRFSNELVSKGYVPGKTFGFVAGYDWYEGHQSSAEGKSSIWYIE